MCERSRERYSERVCDRASVCVCESIRTIHKVMMLGGCHSSAISTGVAQVPDTFDYN